MDTERMAKRLTEEMARIVGDAGHIIYAVAYEEAKGGGWAVVFDTEYAALKAHYRYLGSPGLRFGKSPHLGGWFVSTTGAVPG